jgi:hypothetical protein
MIVALAVPYASVRQAASGAQRVAWTGDRRGELVEVRVRGDDLPGRSPGEDRQRAAGPQGGHEQGLFPAVAETGQVRGTDAERIEQAQQDGGVLVVVAGRVMARLGLRPAGAGQVDGDDAEPVCQVAPEPAQVGDAAAPARHQDDGVATAAVLVIELPTRRSVPRHAGPLARVPTVRQDGIGNQPWIIASGLSLTAERNSSAATACDGEGLPHPHGCLSHRSWSAAAVCLLRSVRSTMILALRWACPLAGVPWLPHRWGAVLTDVLQCHYHRIACLGLGEGRERTQEAASSRFRLPSVVAAAAQGGGR